jgi:hypothetical protein
MKKYHKIQTKKLKKYRFLFTIYFYGNFETKPIEVNILTDDNEKITSSLMVVKEIRVYKGKKGEEILYKTIPVRSFLEGKICI